MNDENVAVIPVRDFGNAKLRLRKILDDSQRSRLAVAMLRSVVGAACRSEIDRVLVVSSNREETRLAISPNSKLEIIQEDTNRGGVNQAFRNGLDTISRRDNKIRGTIILIPGDLPLLDSPALNYVLELKNKEKLDIIINGSRKKDGTNLLAMNPSRMIPFHFDDNSFVKHQYEAKRLGLKLAVIDLDQFSIDVDDEEDLHYLRQEKKIASFEDLIAKLDTGNR